MNWGFVICFGWWEFDSHGHPRLERTDYFQAGVAIQIGRWDVVAGVDRGD